MPAVRTRRIVRTAVLVVAVVVLLPVGYVSSAASLIVVDSAGYLPPAVANSQLTSADVFPLAWYVDSSEWPGAAACNHVIDWSIAAGVQIDGQ